MQIQGQKPRAAAGVGVGCRAFLGGLSHTCASYLIDRDADSRALLRPTVIEVAARSGDIDDLLVLCSPAHTVIEARRTM